MTFITQKTKLIDCDRQIQVAAEPVYRELLLVEGDSASQSVARVRNSQFQAVLPMQGKPMNATKATDRAVRKNQWFGALIDALGVGWHAEDMAQLRYDRVLFLFDPDADGIHCGALMLMFFDDYLRPLLDAHRVSLIKSPLFEIRAAGYADCLHAYSEEHLQRIRSALDVKQIQHSHHRYRGLASLNANVLRETCIDPDSRTAYLLQHRDALTAKAIFGRKI
ncbi:toprim domain-containing protein [Stieleria tagensis]|uniref:toprim domain-containing protein n=1 Tax=Stieleria tagensis TaxID=2956795 RepID=UPI00209B7C0E|nr:toprim domain-containing protein [Stieleria tagensis]